jgi:L-seryl-tRNA(Ser) seleniumtransferase
MDDAIHPSVPAPHASIGLPGRRAARVSRGRPVASLRGLCSNTGTMTPKTDSASAARDALLRQIPSVDELLGRPSVAELVARAGRALVLETAREVLADLRAHLAREAAASVSPVDLAQIEARIVKQVEKALTLSLRPVINATGVVLHTNLGRAPLSPRVVEHLAQTATRYSNLEYDVEAGARGKRDVHTAGHLARLAGAESAIVVNNNAAAVFLVLNTLAKGAEVIVSRGELIEIGDGFRIPDIMAESGALLREVGTTNRTRIADYERAINERTRLLLRVHPSNFRIVGFAERPSLEELAALGRRFSLPVFEDLGSGCLADLASAGISEPVARASFDAGAQIVTFSGDKMLGGPQAGVIAGEKEIVERIRRNPLFRALRVDKLTIAALEVTLGSYRRGALDEIPALRMIRSPLEELERRSKALVERLAGQLPEDANVEIVPGFSVIGGGSTPDQSLPTRLVAISTPRHSAAKLEERLRHPERGAPVISRIEDDRLVLDLRTVFPEEESALAATLAAALR